MTTSAIATALYEDLAAAVRGSAQAGEPAIAGIAARAGFTRFRRAAETPFSLVLEAGP